MVHIFIHVQRQYTKEYWLLGGGGENNQGVLLILYVACGPGLAVVKLRMLG